MSLAPPWAKAAAVLGLKMQILQLRITATGNIGAESVSELIIDQIHSFEEELRRIEEMKA
jgi:predicted nuclease of predicted toxin-antitoxin system